MSDSVQTLLALYHEQTEQARHHENQRATITNYVLLLTGGVLGLIKLNQSSSAQVSLGCFLAVVGCFGAAVSAKHYERNRYHSRLAGMYRSQIEHLQPDTTVDRNAVRQKQEQEFPFLNGERLWKYWVALHALVAGLGLLLAALAWAG